MRKTEAKKRLYNCRDQLSDELGNLSRIEDAFYKVWRCGMGNDHITDHSLKVIEDFQDKIMVVYEGLCSLAQCRQDLVLSKPDADYGSVEFLEEMRCIYVELAARGLLADREKGE